MPDLPVSSVLSKEMFIRGIIPFLTIIGVTLLIIIITIILVNKEIRR